MNRYLIAEAVGGVMEKPEFDYINYDIIEAKNEKEALAKYKVKHNSGYWFPECMAKRICGIIIICNNDVTYREVNKLKEK